MISIKHAKVSLIEDDPDAVAAGEVVPSDWNAEHELTGLGTAAAAAVEDFATAAQGALADSAVQPEDLGTAASADTTDFATAAQGALADTAVQPSDLGTAAAADTTAFATAAQGALADSALQPTAIGSTVQAYDADLDAWSGISPSTKQDTLVSGTNVKTINGASLLGSGNLVVVANDTIAKLCIMGA